MLHPIPILKKLLNAAFSFNLLAALDESQTSKSVTASPIIVDEAKRVQDKLQKFNEMRVLLVGKSVVGKSSFIN